MDGRPKPVTPVTPERLAAAATKRARKEADRTMREYEAAAAATAVAAVATARSRQEADRTMREYEAAVAVAAVAAVATARSRQEADRTMPKYEAAAGRFSGREKSAKEIKRDFDICMGCQKPETPVTPVTPESLAATATYGDRRAMRRGAINTDGTRPYGSTKYRTFEMANLSQTTTEGETPASKTGHTVF